MAKEIRLDEIGAHMEEQVEKLLRKTVLKADEQLKVASPVDLGRFRNSWAIGQNAAPFAGLDEGDYQTQKPPLRRANYGTEKLGNYYSIHNNLPYAEKLAYAQGGSGKKEEQRYDPERKVTNWATPGKGSSHQTNGPGWIDLINNDLRDYVKAEYERIKRQS
mgnify:CR=1 FL=1